MNRLLITPRHLQTISRHAAMTYPRECCGVLIGHSGAGTTIVERVLSVGNERQDGRDRYLIHPETVLAAHQQARALGFEVVGYYHSHPDHPAVPSKLDRENAWPEVSYVIAAVQGGRVTEARSWRLSAGRERFEEEAIEQGAGLVLPFGVHKEAS